jgi:hypothetical protein
MLATGARPEGRKEGLTHSVPRCRTYGEVAKCWWEGFCELKGSSFACVSRRAVKTLAARALSMLRFSGLDLASGVPVMIAYQSPDRR